MNPTDLDHTVFNVINTKAEDLENKLDQDVIFYFGAIHPSQFRVFRDFIEDVVNLSERTDRKLAVVLKTPGGSAETVDRYVTVIRQHYDDVTFIVPEMAMSAGTIFCMSGDRIMMDYSSALGPIDPQVIAADQSGYVAALGYLDKVAEISAKPKLAPADVVLLKSMDLGVLALYEQARDLSIDLLKKWLVEYKFKDWTLHRTTNRGKPVTQDEKQVRAEEIAAALSDHRLWHSHGRSLSLEKLQSLRLEIDDFSANTDLRSAIRQYHDLLTVHLERYGQPFFLHNCRVNAV